MRAIGVAIIEAPVVALDGDDDGRLRRVRLADREPLDRDALFFFVGWRLRTDLARRLGCGLRDDGSIVVDSGQATTVDRVYAAGNCADPRALVPAAAGSGVTAAVAINARLSFGGRRPRSRRFWRAGARFRGPLIGDGVRGGLGHS